MHVHVMSTETVADTLGAHSPHMSFAIRWAGHERRACVCTRAIVHAWRHGLEGVSSVERG